MLALTNRTDDGSARSLQRLFWDRGIDSRDGAKAKAGAELFKRLVPERDGRDNKLNARIATGRHDGYVW
jgi:hypothetical protein